MDWLDVLHRIERGENEKTEFKSDLGNLRGAGKTLCAFANGSGGLVIVGVDDSGAIVGTTEDPDAVQERLTSFLRTGCGRPITANCGRFHAEEGWVHWVEVLRHRRRHEPFFLDGRYWIRRARSTVAPSPSELLELFNVFGFLLTEEQVVTSASAKDIDLDAFRSFMRAQGKELEEEPQPNIELDLQNASACELLDGALHPTLYGLMVFGRDPQSHRRATSLFIQCAAYGGADRAADVLSAGEGKGRLDEQVHRSMGWFRSLGRREFYRGLHRRDVPLVPEEVLRESLVNAVIHREYALAGSQVLLEVFDDRIDVTSPGALPNHMTVERARSGGTPRSRNEMMANAMVVRQLMERRGRGWLLMRRRMLEFNGTEPEMIAETDDRYVRVTFRLKPDSVPNAA